MACSLLWSSAVRVHDSQAYRKMDVTKERISRILELREILLSIQIGFSLVNAAVACAILESNHRSHDNLQQDLADRRMANPMDPVLSHHTSQERQCQNYQTISLIGHPSKVMLKIILNRLKPIAEKIIAEEQACFRAGGSTTEQIFNLRILCEKYLQHQQDLTMFS